MEWHPRGNRGDRSSDTPTRASWIGSLERYQVGVVRVCLIRQALGVTRRGTVAQGMDN